MSHLEFPVSCFSLEYYVLVQNLQKAAILPLDLGVSVVYCHHSVRYSTQQKRTSFFGHWQSPILSCQPVLLQDDSASSVMVVVGPIAPAAAARAWCLLVVWHRSTTDVVFHPSHLSFGDSTSARRRTKLYLYYWNTRH